ncbi:hypothetical protein EJ05DRAFT_488216 [Pseudovirgaria hyperparasitica]|uniref:Uncharacterized protein n=1 Tax=Pseudovirgaria hyperparasitica TaxID=470096 RepID=A0A6A6W336_9PEZI|nr:uncharacterized protein EJ05DRAFT_488216 [Pseudovirgaria hyperparasitica]KAF2755451.1 hypothetical protein EJ05DRAFT_488216 [Pseudovirgaria hyperparasitica]
MGSLRDEKTLTNDRNSVSPMLMWPILSTRRGGWQGAGGVRLQERRVNREDASAASRMVWRENAQYQQRLRPRQPCPAPAKEGLAILLAILGTDISNTWDTRGSWVVTFISGAKCAGMCPKSVPGRVLPKVPPRAGLGGRETTNLHTYLHFFHDEP